MPEHSDVALEGFGFETDLVFVGNLCGRDRDYKDYGSGIIHFVRAGKAQIEMAEGGSIMVAKPSLVFFPRPKLHRILAVDAAGVDLVCARTRFLGSEDNPLAGSFPPVLTIALDDIPALAALLPVFFDEALSDGLGRRELLEKFCVVLLIYMSRYAIDKQLIAVGPLAGLRDKQVGAALHVIHRHYADRLTLARLTSASGMSRSQFFERFRDIVGHPPGEYLTLYRMAVAQKLLRTQKPVKSVAQEVGYQSTSAFVRKFRDVVGDSPTGWRERDEQR